MIERVAKLRVVVPKFADARVKLDGVLVRYGAYAASLQISTAEGSPRALTASLRIPAAQLFALILLLSEVAPVLLLWLVLLAPIARLVWRRFRAMQAALS